MKIHSCELCQREVPRTTKHHLIPRTVHKNKWFKKNFEKAQLHQTVDLCRLCHREIHRQIDEKTLGKSFNTIEKLLEHETLQGFLKWVKKQN